MATLQLAGRSARTSASWPGCRESSIRPCATILGSVSVPPTITHTRFIATSRSLSGRPSSRKSMRPSTSGQLPAGPVLGHAQRQPEQVADGRCRDDAAIVLREVKTTPGQQFVQALAGHFADEVLQLADGSRAQRRTVRVAARLIQRGAVRVVAEGSQRRVRDRAVVVRQQLGARHHGALGSQERVVPHAVQPSRRRAGRSNDSCHYRTAYSAAPTQGAPKAVPSQDSAPYWAGAAGSPRRGAPGLRGRPSCLAACRMPR